MKCLCLFTVSIRARSDDGKHRNKRCTVNIAFSSSRNEALIEGKRLQYTTLSTKVNHCTLSKLKTQVFTSSDVHACVSIHCTDRKQHSNPNFLTKSIDNTLQTCVDIANVYLQAYNIGGCVKNYLFGVCMNLNVQFIQGFCEKLYSSTNLLSLNSVFLNNIRSKQYKGASGEGSASVQDAAGVTESDCEHILCLAFLSWGRLLLLRSFNIWIPSDYIPTLVNDTFAIINTQSSNMQGEHRIMIAKFRHELYFADSLGCKGYSFLNKHYNQMMPAPLQSHSSVCGFCRLYAAFHLFKFRQEEVTGVHDVNVLSFISNYM